MSRTYRNYYKDYFRKRRNERLAEATVLLGGKCTRCDTTNNLHFHHPEDNKFRGITDMVNYSHKRFIDEVLKCELLCISCHGKETVQIMERAPKYRFFIGKKEGRSE